MDNAIYAAITRQAGLSQEMRSIANNIANANTTGFRREGVIFAEHLTSLQKGTETLSMAAARGRVVDLGQAGLTQTNGTYDLAIEGDGFFGLAGPEGTMLTRAGAFVTGPDGTLMTADGYGVLDDGQAPIAIPPGSRSLSIGPDGTISADDNMIGRVGIFAAPDASRLTHQSGTIFSTDQDLQPAESAKIQQGFLEDSNVDPIFEITRMVEVQRAYELGQSFIDREDQRIRATITSLTR